MPAIPGVSIVTSTVRPSTQRSSVIFAPLSAFVYPAVSCSGSATAGAVDSPRTRAAPASTPVADRPNLGSFTLLHAPFSPADSYGYQEVRRNISDTLDSLKHTELQIGTLPTSFHSLLNESGLFYAS
ncbi:hypothetical protein GCM10010439_05940 [Actinocorallia aurantiaca]|uniref:Uncharacterized protein n=1 Tax=Actinocorallia aurantiaca TaxID=46204 RepID=A0ABN3TVA0_9ACTN